MSALILFSGGKDSVLGYKKAIDSGKIVEAGIGYSFSDSHKMNNNVVEAIANACGIPDFTMYSYTNEEITSVSLTTKLADAILLKKESHPNIDTLIVGADGSQTLSMLLFYIRIAHAAKVSVYVPYYDSYDTEFFKDLLRYNLEIRLHNYAHDSVDKTYNPNDIVPVTYLLNAFKKSNTSLYSEMHTIITNAKFYKRRVRTKLVNNVIQLL